jgi:hypothetical protein
MSYLDGPRGTFSPSPWSSRSTQRRHHSSRRTEHASVSGISSDIEEITERFSTSTLRDTSIDVAVDNAAIGDLAHRLSLTSLHGEAAERERFSHSADPSEQARRLSYRNVRGSLDIFGMQAEFLRCKASFDLQQHRLVFASNPAGQQTATCRRTEDIFSANSGPQQLVDAQDTNSHFLAYEASLFNTMIVTSGYLNQASEDLTPEDMRNLQDVYTMAWDEVGRLERLRVNSWNNQLQTTRSVPDDRVTIDTGKCLSRLSGYITYLTLYFHVLVQTHFSSNLVFQVV